MKSSGVIDISPEHFIWITQIENLTVVRPGVIVTRENTVKLFKDITVHTLFHHISSVDPEPIDFKVTHGNFAIGLFDCLGSIFFVCRVNPRQHQYLEPADCDFSCPIVSFNIFICLQKETGRIDFISILIVSIVITDSNVYFVFFQWVEDNTLCPFKTLVINRLATIKSITHMDYCFHTLLF